MFPAPEIMINQKNIKILVYKYKQINLLINFTLWKQKEKHGISHSKTPRFIVEKMEIITMPERKTSKSGA